MKSKIIGFVLSFVVMIAVTPFVFDKLMNSRFDKMLANLQKRGVIIKEIEDKSSYLKTDRVFEVTLPKSVLGTREIEWVRLKVEAIFNNSPVTDVKFKGNVEKVQLSSEKDTKALNELIDKKIRFLVVTPNFKTYRYKIEDTVLEKDNLKVGYKGINGIFEINGYKKNRFYISKIYIQDLQNKILLQADNFKTSSVNEANTTKSDYKLDMLLKSDSHTITLSGISGNNITSVFKKLSSVSVIDISKIAFDNQFFVYNTKFSLNLKDVDYKAVENKEVNEENLIKLLEKGLKLKSALFIKDVKLKNEDIGFLDAQLDLDFRPTSNIFSKIMLQQFDFVDAKLIVKAAPKMVSFLNALFPQSAILFANAKQSGDALMVDIELKNQEITVNGQRIK